MMRHTSGSLLQSSQLANVDQQDNFCSPKNDRFYASHPYAALDPDQREIRLLQVHPHRIHGTDLPQLFPNWNKPGNDFQSMTTQPPYLSGNPPMYEGIDFDEAP